MHLKNFSMIKSEIGWVLAPAYDLLNVKIILPQDKEDTAILLGGKKENFNITYFDRFGENLGLNLKQVNSVFSKIQAWQTDARAMIQNSFLSPENKTKYDEQISKSASVFDPV